MDTAKRGIAFWAVAMIVGMLVIYRIVLGQTVDDSHIGLTQKDLGGDYCIAVFKIGDQSGEGFKDGQLVSVFDFSEQEPGFVFGEINSKIFYCQKIPRSEKEFYRSKMVSYEEQKDLTITRTPPKAIIRFDRLTEADQSIVADADAINPVKLLDAKTVDFDKDAEKLNAPRLDLNAWKGETVTVGSGGDYATLVLLAADADTFTENGTATIISNITSDASAEFKNELDGYTMSFTGDPVFNGDPTSGWLVTVAHNSSCINLTHNCAGVVNISGLRFLRTVNTANAAVNIIRISTVTTKANVFNCRMKSNGTGGCVIFNTDEGNKIWNCVLENAYSGFRGTVNDVAGSAVENLILKGAAIFNNNAVRTYRNIVIIGVSHSGNIISSDNSTSLNCATDSASVGAATNTNAVVNITAADEFVSLVDTSAYYFKVKAGVLHEAGATPGITANITGIRGNARPGADSKVSIGADEYWIPTFDTTYRDTVLCGDGVTVQSDSVQTDSLNWIDTTAISVVYRILSICPTDASGIYKNRMYRNRIYPRGIYKQPIWRDRDEME
jgi:hypothetical protein